MLKSLFSIIAAVLFSISTFASTPKMLVAYFSRAGENWLNEIGILPIMADSDTPDAVDLGLSIKWATYNVGATQPNDYGKLYGWADPSGDQTSETLEDYPSEEPPVSICGTEYDIATVNRGNQWRMPTQAECVELAENCSWEWTEMDGVNGMKATGKNGNSIFLPAVASRTGDKISNQVGQRGCYWSGTLWPDNSNFASYLYFYSDASRVQPSRSNRRYIGMSVRPVYIEGGTGIENVEIDRSSNFSVSIEGYILRIDNFSSNTPVSIYDIMGRLIFFIIESAKAVPDVAF